ncbi:MAG TPA: hypothetical protein VMV05_11800 [bacterium]|nr:hypothetical protein [bacterium]
MGIGQKRIYQRLASLDFQKNSNDQWVYFPWGTFGKGYYVKSQAAKDELEKFVARFSSVHTPLTAILGLVLFVTWYYLDSPLIGFGFLTGYLPLAYLWLGVGVRQRTATLAKYPGKFNQKNYSTLFLKIFHWKALLEPELILLLVLMAGIWIWLSNKWIWYFAPDDVYIIWIWVGFSALGFLFFTFWHYFRDK